ncbi:hypothetical protein Ththe16_2125 (plasmid) [Thermus thermophilus SG0.5JP17-16]|uniref:RNase H type-1 domain-containing protein n=1 Tax=Thermus thermophilus (strain SG0.5JP17-16) TaxID=762633 RepID=F6DJA5_THETG|nr:hypothetical protein [Thermus thermophilus]AEG34502.1 hypothetical protein Ththe16_2125 [Thermus thermophilus SG0.5JP17-16]
MSKPVVVYTDASVDTERGVGGLAVLGLVQAKGGGRFSASLSLPVEDSTLAEVMAVKLALEVVLVTLGPGTQVTLFCDNESVVEHLQNGKRNGRQDLNRALEGVARLRGLLRVTFRHKPRCSTPEMRWVDARAKEALEWARKGGPIVPGIQASKPEPSRAKPKGLLWRILRWILGG